MGLFNFVQDLTVAHDAINGLPVPDVFFDACDRKQKLAEVKEKARLECVKVREEIRKLKNAEKATGHDLDKATEGSNE